MKRVLALTTLAALLAGCAVGPDYARPALQVPPQYPAQAVSDSQSGPPASWWTLYGDLILDTLVADALARNSDIELAVARVAEAEAFAREAGTSIFPSIDGSVGATRSRVSASTATPAIAPLVRNDVRVALGTSFEVDFWGRLRRGREGANAAAEGSRYGRDVVLLSIAGLVAQTYFSLRALDVQVRLARSTLTARRDSFDVAQSRARAGLASDLDLNQSRIALADASILARDLSRQRELAEHQLAVLTGKLEQRVPPVEQPLPALPSLPATGLPSSLLERRPDVRQAEQQLTAANAQIGVAKAAYFPTITLAANDGGQSTALASTINASATIWSVGLNAVVPLLDWGRTTARVDGATARRDQAVATYRKTAETAFREVADALSEVRQYRELQRELEERASYARNTLALVNTRYRSGYSAYLEVLDAQRTTNDAEQSVVRNRLALLAASVNLMKALGGGWAAPGA
ncbi:MAG: efflux transporter outer membrane subunit [Usitatibacter sp.]